MDSLVSFHSSQAVHKSNSKQLHGFSLVNGNALEVLPKAERTGLGLDTVVVDRSINLSAPVGFRGISDDGCVPIPEKLFSGLEGEVQ